MPLCPSSTIISFYHLMCRLLNQSTPLISCVGLYITCSSQSCLSMSGSFSLQAYQLNPSAHRRANVERQIRKTDTQWAETVRNWGVHFIDKNHFPMSSRVSEWVSERTNERSVARERSEQCRACEWVSGASERASGVANDPVLYASTSYAFYPTCRQALNEYTLPPAVEWAEGGSSVITRL